MSFKLTRRRQFRFRKLLVSFLTVDAMSNNICNTLCSKKSWIAATRVVCVVVVYRTGVLGTGVQNTAIHLSSVSSIWLLFSLFYLVSSLTANLGLD